MDIEILERSSENNRPTRVKLISKNSDEADVLAALHIQLLRTEENSLVYSTSFSGIIGHRTPEEGFLPMESVIEISY